MTLRDRLLVADEVAAALADGMPVVALESTLISHGLPYPQNVEVVRAAEAAVREAGAVPATIAIRRGRVLVGVSADDVEWLATAHDVVKAARPNLAAALVQPGWAATTVSATMLAADAAGIRVFATGGIGGVHRGAIGGARPTLDISSDLEELARTPVVVVCAGPKAILDVPATIEFLETRGVPVIVVGSDVVPGFYARRSGVRAPIAVQDVDAAAELLAAHGDLGLGSGALVCVPAPAADALPENDVEAAIAQAIDEATAAGIHGPATTPWLLARVAEITNGASLRANAALIANNAGVGGELAMLLARRTRRSRGSPTA